MNTLKNVWNWVLFSSANPDKISLTLKALIPFLVFLKVGDIDTLNGTFEVVGHFVLLTVTWVSGAITAFGALRKLWYSFFPKRQY